MSVPPDTGKNQLDPVKPIAVGNVNRERSFVILDNGAVYALLYDVSKGTYYWEALPPVPETVKATT